ncbi:16S rRNA (cytidine(1402)-2'-O)-methyltransferase [Minwuia thermotolerans]|uniref:Ribosomal RNA small subunit methyltransferase I n=1 Tax=Minwuia thermotolerans TaxID=2056226 RepID=A0A2M9FY81_9PROT|nr:16S rRNA (cytidine(1402)-2'-O)-methyltransferase [Minwuia thermotolerans]PJK28399.1 16S rRNA (cytidine(1402)-2'-O)-methyltransferase [Minwuia thermotolerans]
MVSSGHPTSSCTEPVETDPRRPKPGSGLYVVATPIGNLGDISERAREVLASADLVLAEDRRMAARLLQHIGVRTTVANYHEHNAARARPDILRRLAEGQVIALTSDAGTPLISDPGYRLVDEALEAGVAVRAVPGPSAVIAALSVSGLPTDRFMFVGFPPPKQAARRSFLAEVAGIAATLVFYESPRRLPDCLRDMAAVLGDRPAAVARELTKLHEEVRRGGLPDLADHYTAAGPPKGEIVIIVGPPAAAETDWAAIDRELADRLTGESLRDAVDAVAAGSGAPRKAVYRRALALKNGDGGA